MKMTLNQSIIINKLSIDVKPDLDQQGRVVYLPNPERKPYLITDNHGIHPLVLVSKSVRRKNLYHSAKSVVSRQSTGDRGQSLKQVIRSTIGNVSDFASIDQARETARKFVQTMKLTKRNPTR
jgi:hypothetical protein